MGRAPCCDERLGLKKGPWTPEEDQKLVAYVHEHGHGNWRALPEKAGLSRCGKSCRLRWTNYLRPDIKRGRFSPEEEQNIIHLHAILGNRWSAIASHLPRRTDNEIKNYWNTHLKKRLTQMGLDPVTHTTSAAGLALSQQWTPLASTRLSHMTQWEITLAQAQARLSKTTLRNGMHAHPPGPVPELPHPSSLFMRAWNTTTHEPSNATIAPTPIATRNWQSVLGLPGDTEPIPFSTALANIGSPEPAFPKASRFAYNHADMAAVGNVYISSVTGDDVAIENLFSPTSILQGPDSESCNTSASAGSNADCLATLLRHSAGFPSFPLQEDAHDIAETFWQAEGNALLGSQSEGELELQLIVPLEFATGDANQEFFAV